MKFSYKNFMKLILAVAVLAAFSTATFAKEVTLTGEGKCLKCALKKADKCQNVVEVKEGDHTTTYKLTGDVSKGFHKEICSETKKVKVTGTLDKEHKELAVTHIEAVK
ncbi:MAG: hypothetical protein RIS56_1653 [Verrucomicrobiota bacterium]|mgnify:FL=1